MMKFIFNVCTHHFDKQIQNEKPKLWRCWGNTVLNCHHLVLLVYQVLGQDETIATVCQLTRHTTYLFYKVLYLHLPGNVISLHCCWLYYSTISFELHNVYLTLRWRSVWAYIYRFWIIYCYLILKMPHGCICL